ncbi:MAG: hypothetical protein M0005_11895 [Actinomycetota bacterium]|nr:hypothetical protein [Actinomycetota bacterium]
MVAVLAGRQQGDRISAELAGRDAHGIAVVETGDGQSVLSVVGATGAQPVMEPAADSPALAKPRRLRQSKSRHVVMIADEETSRGSPTVHGPVRVPAAACPVGGASTPGVQGTPEAPPVGERRGERPALREQHAAPLRYELRQGRGNGSMRATDHRPAFTTSSEAARYSPTTHRPRSPSPHPALVSAAARRTPGGHPSAGERGNACAYRKRIVNRDNAPGGRRSADCRVGARCEYDRGCQPVRPPNRRSGIHRRPL